MLRSLLKLAREAKALQDEDRGHRGLDKKKIAETREAEDLDHGEVIKSSDRS